MYNVKFSSSNVFLKKTVAVVLQCLYVTRTDSISDEQYLCPIKDTGVEEYVNVRTWLRRCLKAARIPE